MKHHLVGQLLGIGRVTLTPVVTHSISKDVPVTVESSAGDSSPNGWISFQTVLCILIPEMKSTVTASGAESAMDRVKGDVVNGVDVADVALVGRGLAVTFEAEVGARVLIFDILDGTAALDTTDGKPGGIDEAAYHPRLPLKRGLHSLVEFGGVVEVDDVDVPVCRTNHQELALYVHSVYPFLALNRGNRGGLSEIPVFDRLVPRTGDEKRRISRWVRNHVTASNGSIVSRDLHGSCSTSRKIEHAGSLIGSSSNDFGTILHAKK